MSDDKANISGGKVQPGPGETVTSEDSKTAEVRFDGSATLLPYHETYEVNKETGEKELTGSGHST